ncbi:unnamed protein product [Urochloa humidicola]
MDPRRRLLFFVLLRLAVGRIRPSTMERAAATAEEAMAGDVGGGDRAGGRSGGGRRRKKKRSGGAVDGLERSMFFSLFYTEQISGKGVVRELTSSLFLPSTAMALRRGIGNSPPAIAKLRHRGGREGERGPCLPSAARQALELGCEKRKQREDAVTYRGEMRLGVRERRGRWR